VTPILMALVSIALSVAAQFLLRAGVTKVTATEGRAFTSLAALSDLANTYVIAGFFLYALGAVVWLGVLSKWEVSKAYPLVGLGFVLTLVIGAAIGEAVTWPRVVGATLICAGVLMVGRS
jgi:drug/metabolite transporter (DMT)-like permease